MPCDFGKLAFKLGTDAKKNTAFIAQATQKFGVTMSEDAWRERYNLQNSTISPIQARALISVIDDRLLAEWLLDGTNFSVATKLRHTPSETELLEAMRELMDQAFDVLEQLATVTAIETLTDREKGIISKEFTDVERAVSNLKAHLIATGVLKK